MATISELPPETLEVITGHLAGIYGSDAARSVLPRLTSIMRSHDRQDPAAGANGMSERDVFLITYPDQVSQPGEPPLQTLHGFLRRWLLNLIGGVHILPFFPSSSDDGFAVVDYLRVDPQFGTWDDIESIAADFRLMLDGVINHVSAQSAWYQGFLRGEPRFQDYFIVVDPEIDLSAVVRPRALPLLTEAEIAGRTRNVWTTFSTDQIDLNYANPEVLLDVIDALLFYTDHGARVIRLDAIAYLWKEIGTSCIHLTRTHRIVKLLRAVFDAVAPGTLLISETNVPHSENISYFGDGDEAQLVYQFPLPPLVLHTFMRQDASRLTGWARALAPPPPGASFFNFLASHDGVGLNPARGILDDEDIEFMVDRVVTRQGRVSYRSAGPSRRAPYELNINYLDALTPREEFESDPPSAAARFLAAHAIMLSLRGVPGIYFHSLFGSRNDLAGVERTGAARSINREKLELSALEREVNDERSLRGLVFAGFRRLLRRRFAHPAFSPLAGQQVLSLGSEAFCLVRSPAEDGRHLACLHNVTNQPLRLDTHLVHKDGETPRDLLTGEPITLDSVPLEAYQARWIEFVPEREGPE